MSSVITTVRKNQRTDSRTILPLNWLKNIGNSSLYKCHNATYLTHKKFEYLTFCDYLCLPHPFDAPKIIFQNHPKGWDQAYPLPRRAACHRWWAGRRAWRCWPSPSACPCSTFFFFFRLRTWPGPSPSLHPCCKWTMKSLGSSSTQQSKQIRVQ